MIHGEGKIWGREEGPAGSVSESKKGRLGHLMGKGGKGERQNEIREGGGGTAVRVVTLRAPCDPFPVCKSLVTFRIQLEHSY